MSETALVSDLSADELDKVSGGFVIQTNVAIPTTTQVAALVYDNDQASTTTTQQANVVSAFSFLKISSWSRTRA